MKLLHTFFSVVFFVLVHFQLCAQVTATNPPGFSFIRESEIRKDLFYLAGDEMRGRRAGTTDELKAAAWIAEQARKAGLQPAGDNGSYFQYFSLRRTQLAETSTLQIGGRPMHLGSEAWITSPMEVSLQSPVQWLPSMSDTATINLSGKVVAMRLLPPSPMPTPGVSLWGYRYILFAIRQQSSLLRNKGASAVVLVADSVADANMGFAGDVYAKGLYQLEGGAVASANIPVIVVRQSFSSLVQAATTVSASFRVTSYLYPSANVVASAPGTDLLLKKEYVLFSGHHDHDGVGVPVAGDSIWNGADDNATACVALLAIGRAWKAKPGKRSALFVWHGAEERGLFGSRWFAEHPTVPKVSIAAVLNADMIGRNTPDSAALLGVTPPNRNAAVLVQMALQANRLHTKFMVDTTWDNPRHPENWYFRSDHLPYARAGIPALFFTTLLHPDYHTPKDEASTINISKLARMTRWMYATGWAVSNTEKRVPLDVK